MTNYPASIDTNENLPVVLDNISEIGTEAINALRVAVLAIENTLGINPQGSTTSLSERLNAVINSDGTFKSAALVSAGLIALPIENSQVASNAAIAESKLDLDFSTNSLHGRIASNDTDIIALQSALANEIQRFTSHINGLTNRHDGYDIDISGLQGQPSITTVEQALTFIYGAFLSHKAALIPSEHNASAIRYETDENGIITSDNVQDAIEEIDTIIQEEMRLHYDIGHDNGLSQDGYTFSNAQTNLNDCGLRITRYQSAGGVADIIKIGMLNAASVTTKNFNVGALDSSNSGIKITVKSGNSYRDLTITGLETARYPSTNTDCTLAGVVDYINEKVALLANHFPISAYEADGELALQHNISRSDCSIMVSDSASDSAINALGFSGVSGVEIYPISENKVVIDGYVNDELKTVSDGYVIHPSLSSALNLGVDVTSNGLNLQANMLVHIYSHSTASANGTYRIVQISPASPSPNTTIGLATTIAAGSFRYVIYQDVALLDFVGSPKVIDVYLDSNLSLTANARATITFGGIGGIKIIHLSDNFKTINSGTLVLSTSGAQKSIHLTDGSIVGVATLFDPGYIGYVRVASPDNEAYAIVLVFDASVTNGTDSLSCTDRIISDDRLMLGSVHFDASAVVELPIHTRTVGLVGTNSISNAFIKNVLERDIAAHSANSVINGFESSVVSGNEDIIITGGQAYIDGKFISKSRETINIIRSFTTDGSKTVALGRDGRYHVFNITTVGFTYGDLALSKDYLPIAVVAVNSGAIQGVIDVRMYSALRPTVIVDSRDGFGHFKKLNVAGNYLTTINNLQGSFIIVTSDLVIDSSPILGYGTKVVIHGNLNCTDDYGIFENSTLEVYGNSEFTDTLRISTNATAEFFGSAEFIDIIIEDGGTLIVHNEINATRIDMTGPGASIVGATPEALIVFDGTENAINLSSDHITIKNIKMMQASTAFPLISVGASCDNLIIENCDFSQDDSGYNESNWSVAARSGILFESTTSNIVISNTRFYNFSNAISGNDGTTSSPHTSLSNVIIDKCFIERCGVGIYIESGSKIRITNSYFLKNKSAGIYFANNTDNTLNSSIIENCIFSDISDTSTSLTPISLNNGPGDLIISSNIFTGITTTTSIISCLQGTFFPTNVNIIGNQIISCSATGYAIDCTGAVSPLNISNNTIYEHTGDIINAPDATVTGNIFMASANSGANPVVKAESTGIDDSSPVWSGNKFVLNTNKEIELGNVLFSNNEVVAFSIVISSDVENRGFNFSNNIVKLVSGATNGLEVSSSSGTSVENIISGNIINTDASNATIAIVGNGRYSVKNNSLLDNIATNGIEISPSTADSTTSVYSIVGNNLQVNTGTTNGIFIDGDNTCVVDNFIYGTGCSASAIVIKAGRENILINNNFLNATGSEGTTILQEDSDPVNCTIGLNKNAVFTAAYFSGFTSSLSISNSYVILHNLPVGAKIVDIDITVDTDAASDMSAYLMLVDSNSFTPAIVAGPENNVSTGVHILKLTPSVDTYVRAGGSYVVTFNASAADVQVGMVAANLIY